MRHFFFKTLMLFAFLFGNFFLANAQSTNVTLVVTKTNGEELTFQLTEESQLSFENGDRLIIEDGNTNATFPLAEIQKLACTEYTGTDENTLSGPQIFPNPTHNGFLINNLKDTCPVHLYTLDGHLAKTFTATEGIMVDISDLAPGMYLLNINGQTLKMLKL